MSTRDDILNRLNAERYAPASWWKTPPSEHPEHPGATPNFDDSEVTCAKRRRDLLAAVADLSVEEAL